MSKLTLKTERDKYVVVTRRFEASSRSCLPRTHRSKVNTAMDARPRGLDDAGLHQ